MVRQVYINRRPGEQSITIGLNSADIIDVLADIEKNYRASFTATQELIEILRAAREVFAADRQHAAED